MGFVRARVSSDGRTCSAALYADVKGRTLGRWRPSRSFGEPSWLPPCATLPG